jgi:hypothetical protein
MVSIDISQFDIYLGLAITGLFTGLGSCVGTFLANNYLINNSKKIKKGISKRFKLFKKNGKKKTKKKRKLK